MASRPTRSRRPTAPKDQQEPQARAKWTTELTKMLADLMVNEVHKGNKQNKSFGKKAWNCIYEEFHKSTSLNWDRDQLKNRYAVLRKQYVITNNLLSEPDFRWDEPTGAIIATNEAWNKYITEHPDAETIRSTGCSLYKQLCIIFSENGTNGTHNEEGRGGADSFPQPLSMLQGEESSSESEEMTEMPDDLDNKAQFQSTAAFRDGSSRKRGRIGINDVIANAISEMAAASKLRANAVKQYNERFSITDCIKALDEIQCIDEQVYFVALELFNSRNAREIFLSLKVDKRLTWLLGKCSALPNFR